MSNRLHVTKDFKTLNQQISLLKGRNLIIRNEESAKKHLLEKNYFDLINGFETLLLKDSKASNKEYKNLYFEDFLLLYDFDKQLNLNILRLLDKFETRLKTSMAYRFCEKNFITSADADCYLDVSNYTDPRSNYLSLPSEIVYNINNHKIFKTNHYYNGQGNLNYVEFCKSKYPYMQTYQVPPFWMVIKTLEFGPLFKLLLGFERDVFEKVIGDMGMHFTDKQKFINSIRIFIELRNASAHFQLINRFRTPSNLRIDAGMIADLGLITKNNTHGVPMQYELKLYDTLLVLSQFENLTDIQNLIRNFYYKRCNSKRERILFVRLLDRMGRDNLKYWRKM